MGVLKKMCGTTRDDDDRVTAEIGQVTAAIGLDGIEKSLEENEEWCYEALHFRTHDLVHQDQTTLF